MHLAADEVEVDVVVREDPGECFVIPRSSRTGAAASAIAAILGRGGPRETVKCRLTGVEGALILP